MKTTIYKIDGTKGKEIETPKFFSEKIREDVVSKILETRKTKQPYGPFEYAGQLHSAHGKLVHRRHVWKSEYGRGISRVPRKIMSKKGSQFNWQGATVPNARGGRRAHPPKPWTMINTKRINKKEYLLAVLSSLSATANIEKIREKYETLKNAEISTKFPVIIESNLDKIKTKQFKDMLFKVLGEKLFGVSVRNKSVRAGKGKSRGRKYKVNAGLLLVIGEKERFKTGMVETANAKQVGVEDLARGGLGRITIYTEKAIEELNQRMQK